MRAAVHLDTQHNTGQIDHRDQCEKRRARLEQLRPALTSARLRQTTESCRAALTSAPADWILNKNLAWLCEKLGDYPGASEAWRAVVRLMPHYAEAWIALGRAAAEQKRWDEAHAAFAQGCVLTLVW